MSVFISPSRKNSIFVRSSLAVRFSKCENSPLGELRGSIPIDNNKKSRVRLASFDTQIFKLVNI